METGVRPTTRPGTARIPPGLSRPPLYAATYTLIFVPGLLANSLALGVLCRLVRKRRAATIFMANLAAADLAHVLSLPLRMYYYFRRSWPFGGFLCQLCFYLKYLNMYASICFLTCISVQRCLFLLHPFRARAWKARYDIAVSAAVWTVVGAACLALPVLRAPTASGDGTCFSDLEVRRLTAGAAIALVLVAELSGFVIPLAVIVYCTWRMRQLLRESQAEPQHAKENRRAWRMVLVCAAVFFLCFTPYHVNFPLFMMAKQEVAMSCAARRQALRFHPVSLSLASLNCCLDPILYYFMTSEFQERLFQCGLLNRLLGHSSSSATSSDGDQAEGGGRKKGLWRAYFWTVQPHRCGRDGLETPLSG
ncbi:hypothetical protein lerEdw1_002502 [Lerista edwardsae]|nr:hypothetical protein lerEdw1_002502 [Lerista edwardsae]